MKDLPLLKLGFVGGGLNSAVGYTHFASSHLDGLFRLEAGCFSRHYDINSASAARYEVEANRTYTSWKDLIAAEQGRLDAVVVLTPTPTHSEIVSELINADFAVISEKALATSVKECLSIRHTLERKEGFLAVTYNYSGYPMFRELVARCMAGHLGNLHQINVEMPQEGFLRRLGDSQGPSPQAWRRIDYGIPTVSLDLGVHLHHLVDVVSGGLKPLRVSAVQSHSGLVSDVLDNVNALVEYENGLLVNFWYGKTALGIRNGLRLRVYGSEGSGEWLQSEPERLTIGKSDGSIQALDPGSPGLLEASQLRYQRFKPGHPGGFIEAFANLYCDVFYSITNNNTGSSGSKLYVKGVDHSLSGLGLFEEIHNSAATKSWREVPYQ